MSLSGSRFLGRRLGTRLLSRSIYRKGMTPNGRMADLNAGPSDCGNTRPAQPEGYPTPSPKRTFLFRPLHRHSQHGRPESSDWRTSFL